MTVDLSASEFLALAERELRGEIRIQTAIPKGARYTVIFYEPTTEPNRQTDSGQGTDESGQGHIQPQEQLRIPPDLERQGQTETAGNGSVAQKDTQPTRNAQLLTCPQCGSPLHENQTCEICQSLQGLFKVCREKRREYALKKDRERQGALQQRG